MTGAELIGVREAEELTNQKKVPKKDKAKQYGRSKTMKESSDESETDSDIMNTYMEILYCIAVEM
jgi:hypothetical protein